MLQQWRERFQRLSFRQKLQVFPWVAAGALIFVCAVVFTMGQLTASRLSQLEEGYYPSLQSNQSEAQLLSNIKTTLEDLIRASEPERLAETDSLRDILLADLDAQRKRPVNDPAAIAKLDSTFRAYYVIARRVAGDMASSFTLPDEGLARAQKQGELYLQLNSMLDAQTRANRAGIAGLIVLGLMTIAVILALSQLSKFATRSVTEPLAQAVAAADRLAQGDMTV